MEHTASLKIVPYSPSRSHRKKCLKSTAIRKRGGTNSVTKIRNACVSCRNKKTRCSGHLPCIRCRQNGQECQYMPIATPQGPRTSDSQQESRSPEVFRRSSFPEISQESPGDFETTPEEPAQEDQYGHFHGSASGFAFLQLAQARVSRLSPISLDFPDFPLGDLKGVTAVMPPKPIADSLIHNYFDFGLTTSRFVHKPSLIAAYEKLYSEKPSDILGQDQLALVYMVMAVGSHYAETDTNFSGFSASVQYYVMAQRELERERSQITPSSLQARLLCVHYLLNHSRMHNAWSFFGTVVRNAQALRLHRESPGSERNLIEFETRKRLFWSIYVYDRILSSVFGRPAAIHDDDVDQEECELRDDDFETIPHSQLGSATSFCSGAALIHYARLAKILGRVLREFYGPARKKHNLQILREKAIEIQGQLEEWLSNLPSYLNFIILPSDAMSMLIQRQSCTLKLTFAHTSLLLHRPFLLYSIRPDGTGSTENSQNIVQWFQRCSKRSIEAAYLIVNECRSLFSRGLFSRRFWLVNYAQFAAIGTLYMYSIIIPGEPGLREAADEALDQFPVAVEGDLVGQRYLHILQELQKVTLRHGEHDANSGCNSELSETQAACLDESYLLTDEFLNNADPFGATILDSALFDAFLQN